MMPACVVFVAVVCVLCRHIALGCHAVVARALLLQGKLQESMDQLAADFKAEEEQRTGDMHLLQGQLEVRAVHQD